MVHRYNFVPETGQVALFSASNLVGRLIAAIRGPKSHAGIIINSRATGRVFVQEFVHGGSQLWPLSAYLRNGCQITIRQMPDEAMEAAPAFWPRNMEEFAWATWGVWRYSMRHLRRHLIYAAFGGPERDTSQLDGLSDDELRQMVVRMICSEGASFYLRRFAGYDPCPTLSDAATAPRHLYLTDRLVTVVERAELLEADL